MAAILRVKDENGNIVSIPAIKGDKGEKGEKGDRGLPGSGGVPDGGTAGQILTKNSGEDGDAGWKDAVQADWNESDESSSAFVKNRTHYTEYENQLQFDYNEDRNFYTITSSAALDTDKTYELVFDYDIGNDAGGQADALIRRGVINPVTYKGSWVGKFTQKTKYGSTFWCFNDIHPADNSFLPCIYSSDMKMFTGYINGCVNNEAWLNEVKIAVPLDLKYIPETIARASDTVMGTGEEQHFGSAVEEQICSNIGALYRDDLNGYLSDKVDKNQGTANSGKFLGIGADGIVVPTEVGGGSEWNILMDYTVTDEDVTNKVEWFKFCTENAVSAKEIYVLIDWKVISNANLIIRAWGDTEHGNNNYIANIINGFGARNGYNGLWHFKVADLSGSPIIDWEWSSSRGLNSDYSTGKYSKTGQYSLLAVPMTGVNIRPYSYAKVNGEDVEYGLLAGTRFRGWWR